MQEDSSSYSDASSDNEERVKKRAKVDTDGASEEQLQSRAVRVPNDLQGVNFFFSCKI
jgi:hypothetical protein